MHGPVQADDVRPVFKVEIRFDEKIIVLTGSENMKGLKQEIVEAGDLKLPSRLRLALDCNVKMSCNIRVDQNQVPIFQHDIGQFDFMFQPNIFTIR